jgi:hypothetical protein
LDYLSSDQNYRKEFIQSGSGGKYSAAQELLLLADLMGKEPENLLIQDSVGSSSDSEIILDKDRVSVNGNPLWATDVSHNFFAELANVVVHIVLKEKETEELEYDMASRKNSLGTIVLWFGSRHYSVPH